MSDEDGPGWEMQQDNEERRQLEESRALLADFRRDNAQYDNDMKALDTSIRRMT